MIQSIVDSPLSDCPQCEQTRVRKLISPVAFRLRGSGWYETDFKSDNKRNVIDHEQEDSRKASGDDDGSGTKEESANQKSADDSQTKSGESSSHKEDASKSNASSSSTGMS